MEVAASSAIGMAMTRKGGIKSKLSFNTCPGPTPFITTSSARLRVLPSRRTKTKTLKLKAKNREISLNMYLSRACNLSYLSDLYIDEPFNGNKILLF